MRCVRSCSLVLGAALLFSVNAGEGHEGQHHHGEMKAHEGHGKSTTMAAQTTCPVMGGEINKELYADHEGKRVYFCCGGCEAQFQKEPEKYLGKLEEMGQKPESVAPAQTTCPVMGGEINKELYVDHDGRRVYFCCESCVGEFKKDPEKYIEKLDNAGEAQKTKEG